MPEDYESFWKVVRPRRELRPEAPTIAEEPTDLEEATRSAIEEERLQLENLRVSQTLTHLANVFYDLGVFCVTENLLNTPARSVELQLELLPNINRQSNPTSIRGFINPDGTIHLSLGFQEQRP